MSISRAFGHHTFSVTVSRACDSTTDRAFVMCSIIVLLFMSPLLFFTYVFAHSIQSTTQDMGACDVLFCVLHVVIVFPVCVCPLSVVDVVCMIVSPGITQSIPPQD